MNVNNNERNIEYILSEDVYSVLYKKIDRKNLVINDFRLNQAFVRFSKLFDIGDCFSIIDILHGGETVLNGGTVDENAGNKIYTFDYSSKLNKRLTTKLLRNSYNGIYSLFSAHNGISFDIDSIGGRVADGETKRFLVAPQRKCDALIKKCSNFGVSFKYCGEILQNYKILIMNKNVVVDSFDKDYWNKEKESISIDANCYNDFIAGYRAVCSLVLCDKISDNNIIRFGLGGTLSQVLARALGYFSGLMFLKPVSVRKVFFDGIGCNVAVSRPSVSDGDYMYLLKVRSDAYGLPDKPHFGQLFYYLTEKKKEGIIKDVLPVRENIQNTIIRLSGDKYEYVELENVPNDCFGIIVSVGRGESVNGLKLGYFKNI